MIFFLFKCGNDTHTKTEQNFAQCGDDDSCIYTYICVECIV